MFLIINTTDVEKISIALVKKRKIIAQKTVKAKYQQAEKLLPLIDSMIKNKIKDIVSIVVVKGPGSFTALRIGIAVANTLAYTLKIPILGVKREEFKDLENLKKISFKKLASKKRWSFIEPFYNKEPNITVSYHSTTEKKEV